MEISPAGDRGTASRIGARVHGVDLTTLPDDATFRAIERALLEYRVLVFPQQSLTPLQHQAFSEWFGPLQGHVVSRFNLDEAPFVHVLSNAVRDGRKIGADRAGRFWHSDLSYMREPSLCTLLLGIEVPPEGGDTLFADMCEAFDALPEAQQRWLEAQVAVHDYAYHYATFLAHREPLTDEEKARTPPVKHPAVRTHPATGRRCLYVSEGLTSHFEGMDVEESRGIISELMRFATQPQFVYRHQWQQGDLVMWDNRATMHRATPFDEERFVRLMYRTTVLGDSPFLTA